mgnify:CR=1 FL=1|nr:hypothetical protein [uncultured Bifidobacterium sp.]
MADRYVVFDGGHIVQDYEADEFLSLSPGCVTAMGLRAFDLEPYRHRIAALASSPAAEDSPFRWLLAINPLPSRKAFAEGGLLSHLHFQYANDLHTLVATDEATGAETLRNPRWYAHHVLQRGNHRGPLRHHPCVAPLAVDLATYGGMTAPR